MQTLILVMYSSATNARAGTSTNLLILCYFHFLCLYRDTLLIPLTAVSGVLFFVFFSLPFSCVTPLARKAIQFLAVTDFEFF